MAANCWAEAGWKKVIVNKQFSLSSGHQYVSNCEYELTNSIAGVNSSGIESITCPR